MRRRLVHACFALMASAWHPGAHAQTPLTGHYPPGQSGIRGAATPAAGLVYTNFNRFFTNVHVTDDSGNATTSLDELRYANISMFAWTSDYEMLGMHYGAALGIPISTGNLRPAPDEVESTDLGLGDVLLTPFILYGKSASFDYQVQLTLWSASGRFSPGAPDNRGTGFESLVYSLGGVFYPRGNRDDWSLSALVRIEQNFEQEGSGITPGNDIVVDWGVGKVIRAFERMIDLGVSGFAAWQVTSQTGGATSPDLGRYRLFGAGPEANVSITERLSLRFRAQWEFGARNIVEGNNLWLILGYRF